AARGRSFAAPAAPTAPGAPDAPTASRTSGAPDEPGLDPGDEIDPDQPTGSMESVAEARLLEAFPGAEEVRK
ncbi:MAG: hypothetical protein ACRDWE_03965, partial [Acidimicrobiales bacterium]